MVDELLQLSNWEKIMYNSVFVTFRMINSLKSNEASNECSQWNLTEIPTCSVFKSIN